MTSVLSLNIHTRLNRIKQSQGNLIGKKSLDVRIHLLHFWDFNFVSKSYDSFVKLGPICMYKLVEVPGSPAHGNNDTGTSSETNNPCGNTCSTYVQ